MLINEIIADQEARCLDKIANRLGEPSFKQLQLKVDGAYDPTHAYATIERYLDQRRQFKRLGDEETAQGARYLDNTDGTIHKIAHVGRSDGYVKFIRDIRQPKYQNNPFFPRIYDYTYCPEGYIIYCHMEKLVPLSNFNLHSAIRALFDQAGIPSDQYKVEDYDNELEDIKNDLLAKYVYSAGRDDIPNETPEARQHRISQRYRKYREEVNKYYDRRNTPDIDPKGPDVYQMHSARKQMKSYLNQPKTLEQLRDARTNPQFKQRVRYLIKLRQWHLRKYPKNRDELLDLHSGNWMVRLTKHGPQLVILDPIYTGNN